VQKPKPRFKNGVFQEKPLRAESETSLE